MTARVLGRTPPTDWTGVGADRLARHYGDGTVGEVYAVAPGAYAGGIRGAVGRETLAPDVWPDVASACDAVDVFHASLTQE